MLIALITMSTLILLKGYRIMNRLRETLKHESFGPIIRRFFINTLFDSTFMLLGIVVGSAFAGTEAGLNIIILTMLTTSLALGISTGVSVYEAESLEQERKIADLEKALFTDLKDTSIQKTAKYTIIIATLINIATPLFSCAVTITPFVLVALGILQLNIAGWISVALALSTLFGAGVYMGRIGKTNPYKKGLRMVAFGVLAFAIGFILNLLI
jgi:predicted membrane protein (TIGR00267 family)